METVKASPAETSKMLLASKKLAVELRCPICLERLKLSVVADNDYGLILELRAKDPDLGLDWEDHGPPHPNR